MNILEQIVHERKQDVEAARRRVPVARLEASAADRRHHSLVARLRAGGGTAIVAEMKKASPSAGLLREPYAPEALAAAYARAGAAGLSVLTEPRHFMGSETHLRAARKAVALPVLRKDFLCDEYQVFEAAAWGADVVLLIVAALPPDRLHALYRQARALGLDVLVESHTAEELQQALELDQAILGVNSRNLKTLCTDLAVAEDLAAMIPSGRVSLAESGIRTRADIVHLEAAGYDGFLIGETLMKSDDPAAALKGLLGDGDRG